MLFCRRVDSKFCRMTVIPQKLFHLWSNPTESYVVSMLARGKWTSPEQSNELPAEMRDEIIGSWDSNFATFAYRCEANSVVLLVKLYRKFRYKSQAESAENPNVLTVPIKTLVNWRCCCKYRNLDSKTVDSTQLILGTRTWWSWKKPSVSLICVTLS